MVAVLVVEDDETTQFLMSEFVETLGYECEVVPSAEACLSILSARPNAFDVILMDIHMPGMTGLDATRAIRQGTERATTIPIIAVTADIAYHDARMLQDHGINDVLPKPVDLTELDTAILRYAA